jgi:hypothetical protein
VANQAQLALFVLAYNLGNLLRRLGLPKAIKDWFLRSVQGKLIKIGGGLARHARRRVFQLVEVAVPQALSQAVWTASAGYVWRRASGRRQLQGGGMGPGEECALCRGLQD